jgi:hypothetical protein
MHCPQPSGGRALADPGVLLIQLDDVHVELPPEEAHLGYISHPDDVFDGLDIGILHSHSHRLVQLVHEEVVCLLLHPGEAL